METIQFVNAEYATNHHLGFSGVLETSDLVVDEENFGAKSKQSSALERKNLRFRMLFNSMLKMSIGPNYLIENKSQH
jgi:hypothetical protein